MPIQFDFQIGELWHRSLYRKKLKEKGKKEEGSKEVLRVVKETLHNGKYNFCLYSVEALEISVE